MRRYLHFSCICIALPPTHCSVSVFSQLNREWVHDRGCDLIGKYLLENTSVAEVKLVDCAIGKQGLLFSFHHDFNSHPFYLLSPLLFQLFTCTPPLMFCFHFVNGRMLKIFPFFPHLSIALQRLKVRFLGFLHSHLDCFIPRLY